MEQKVKEKINKAVEVLNSRIKKHNQRIISLRDSVFTDDVKEMIDTFTCEYSFRIDDDNVLYVKPSGSMYIYGGNRFFLDLFQDYISAYYDDGVICRIENTTCCLINKENLLDKIENNIEDILNDIIAKYKAKTEEQEDRLDAIFNALGENTKPVRHIKVTVEWY